MYLYPIPSACGEKPLTSAVDGKETMFAFICNFSSWWFDSLWDLLSQQYSVSWFSAGRVGEGTKCSLAGFPRGAEGTGILPIAPLPGQPIEQH